MNKLFYIANVRLPTEKAHGIQIMKTCESLARQGILVELIVPRRKNTIVVDPFEYYGVEKNFTITRLWCVDFLAWKFFKWFGFWLETITFTLAVQFYLRGQQVPRHTRDLLPALVLPGPIFYEIHTVPERVTWLHRRAWQRVKGIVVISDGIKQALVGQGVESKKILVARDAVDVRKPRFARGRAGTRDPLPDERVDQARFTDVRTPHQRDVRQIVLREVASGGGTDDEISGNLQWVIVSSTSATGSACAATGRRPASGSVSATFRTSSIVWTM